MTDEKAHTNFFRKKSTKIIGGVLGLGGIVYLGDSVDISDKGNRLVKGMYNGIIDIFTIDAGEAAEEYKEQILEESNPLDYQNEIADAAETSLLYLEDSKKLGVLSKYTKNLPLELKGGLIYESLKDIPDSIAAKLINNRVDDMSSEYQFNVLKNSAESALGVNVNEFSEGTEDKFNSVKEYLKDNYNTIKKKLEQIF